MCSRIFALCLLIVNFGVQSETLSDYQIPVHGKLSTLSGLAPVEKVREKVVSHIVDNFSLSDEAMKSIKVNRIHLSDIFSVRVEKEYYVVDPSVSYWVSSTLKDLYHFNKGVQRINVSNDMHGSLMKMMPFLHSSNDVLPRYGDNGTPPIYAFMDMNCPHCQRFHLTEREKLNNEGVDLVYVPLVRNFENKKEREVNLYAFCASSDKEIKSRINSLYLADHKKRKTIASEDPAQVAEDCGVYRLSIYDFLLSTGERYGLVGTPMFIVPDGAVLYGYPSLRNYLNKKK